MNQCQKWILTGLFATSLSLAFADQSNQKNDGKMDMSKPDMSREITPSANLPVADGASFFFDLDFIYWQAKEDGLAIGATGDPLPNPITHSHAYTVTNAGKWEFIDAKYEPGFKVGAGLDLAHDGWSVAANYTWLKEHASGHISQTPGTGALVGLVSEDISSISGHWSFYFNVVDLPLSRKFYISKRLTLSPHIGLKGSWMHQTFNVLEYGVGLTANNSGDNDVSLAQRQKFWGVGLRAGLDTTWHFTRDWSIYGNFAMSTLSCQFQDKGTVYGQDAAYGFFREGLIGKTHANQHAIRPVLELALGLRYETMFGSDDYYQFVVQAGWEQQIWWDQNQFLRTADIGGDDLVLQGLDLRVGFRF